MLKIYNPETRFTLPWGGPVPAAHLARRPRIATARKNSPGRMRGLGCRHLSVVGLQRAAVDLCHVTDADLGRIVDH